MAKTAVQPKTMESNHKVASVLSTGLFAILCVLIAFPLLAGFFASFQEGREVVMKGMSLNLDFSKMHLDNYKYLFSGNEDSRKYFMWYKNSLILTLITVALTLLVCYFIAYGLTMYKFKLQGFLFFLVIATMCVPFEILMLPLYNEVTSLGIINTRAGVILPGLCGASTIFFFKQYMQSLPKELLDAGRIDGCTEYGISVKIMMPITKPAFASMAILCAMGSWNNMLWPMLVFRDTSKFTLQIGLNTLLTPYGNNYNLLIAGSMFGILPILIIYLIFQRYLNGRSMEDIAKEITRYGIPTRDKTPYWQTTSIQYVLHNEKYAGDSLAQKTYTTRTLPHRKKRNQGEYDQYFVPGSHPAIIDRELFDRAQALLKQKGAVIHPKSGVTYPWTGTVICGQCGSIFKRKKCRESAYWTCRLHDKSPDKCQITQIPESEFERAFLRLYYKLRHDGMPVLSQLLTDLQTAQNRKLLWSLDIVELNKQIADIVRQERLLAELKQQGLVDPDIYITPSNTLAEQLRTAKLEKERFLESEEDQTIRQTQVLLEILETGPEFLEAFDEELFSELVAKIIVENNECLRFRLINGLELTETIERTVR